MMIFGKEFAIRTIALVVGLIALVILAMWIPSCLQKQRSERAQAKIDRAQSEAFQNSATDAVATQGEVNQRQTESEALTRSNERMIRDAQGANDAVDPAVRDAGFASLCKRPSFRDSPTGRVRCHPAP